MLLTLLTASSMTPLHLLLLNSVCLETKLQSTASFLLGEALWPASYRKELGPGNAELQLWATLFPIQSFYLIFTKFLILDWHATVKPNLSGGLCISVWSLLYALVVVVSVTWPPVVVDHEPSQCGQPQKIAFSVPQFLNSHLMTQQY